MSRIGQNPVSVPTGVTVDVVGQMVTAKGKLGELSMTLVDEVEISREDESLVVKPRYDTQRARTMWGTRAAVEGKELVLQLGYSHEIRFPIPDGISIACERPTVIAVSGANRQLVGQVAANIRAFRKPEPYKGKGVRYADEFILRKEGKKK